MNSLLPLLAVCASLAPAHSRQDDPYRDAHLRNLYVERRLALEEAWAEAEEADRDRVRESLRSVRTGGQPALYAASAQVLTDTRSILVGQESFIAELSPQRRVACSLDLLVLPGAFASVAQDRGDALIVRVLPAYTRVFRRILPEQMQLTLIWISPDGDEVRARSEPVHRDALVLPGFEMYFHAPPSSPGVWHLVPEVEWEGRRGRGVPVAVPCVSNLFERFDRLAAETEVDDHGRWVRTSLERLLLHGARDAADPSVETLLEGAGDVHPSLPLVGWAEDGTTFQVAGTKTDQPTQLLVVVAPVLHEAEWSLVGAEGRAWKALAKRTGAKVIITELPLSHSGGPDVFRLLATLREEHPDLPLTLVLHGSGLGRLQLALLRTDLDTPFDRLVVDSVLWGAPARQLLEVPMLFVSPLEEAPSSLIPIYPEPGVWSESDLYEVRLVDPPPIAAAQLPRWIGDWLATFESSPR